MVYTIHDQCMYDLSFIDAFICANKVNAYLITYSIIYFILYI